MSMFGPRMGSWNVSSKTDPRWNGSGRAAGLVTAGGPPEIHDWVAACRKKFGEPPTDVEISFYKD